MTNLTPRLSLQQPVSPDLVSALRLAIANNAATLDAALLFIEGVLVSRPTATTVASGTFYHSTDTGDLSYSNGTSWVSVAQVGVGSAAVTYQSGTYASRPPAGSDSVGAIYRATDTGLVALDLGTTWMTLNDTFSQPIGPITASPGQYILPAAGTTVTLPLNVPDGSVVTVQAGTDARGSNPVTVSAGASTMFGVGMNLAGATSLRLGTPLAYVALRYIGAVGNWLIFSGRQDSGWVQLTLGSPGSALSAVPGAFTPSYRNVGDEVQFLGAVQSAGGTSDNGTWATGLPSPSRTVHIPVPVVGVKSVADELQVSASGVLTLLYGSLGPITVGLDGLSYHY